MWQPFLQAITLAALAVASAQAQQTRVELTNGDRITGQLIEQSDQSVTLEHPLLGQLTINRSQIAQLQISDAPAAPDAETPVQEVTAPPAAAPKPAADDPPADRGVLNLGLLQGWKRQFEAGVTGSQGNTETFLLRVAARGKYEDEFDRLALDLSYYLGQSNGETDRNEFKSRFTRDWLLPDSKWFYFAEAGYQYDEFEAWEQRITAYGGVGYQFIDTDRWQLRSRFGLGGNYEMGQVNELTPEALLGAFETEYQINERQSLTGYSTFYPNLEDLGEFRNITGFTWNIKVDPEANMSLKLGFENEYESQVEHGEDKNDLKYFGTIGFDF